MKSVDCFKDSHSPDLVHVSFARRIMGKDTQNLSSSLQPQSKSNKPGEYCLYDSFTQKQKKAGGESKMCLFARPLRE